MEVRPSLEGLNPHFHPDVLVIARVEDHNEDFKRRGADPRKAFSPVSNVVNSESILFDSNVGSQMVEAMALLRDRHAMFSTNETMFEFVERLCNSLMLVSHWTLYFFISKHNL